MKQISSRQNPLVRAFRDLADAPDPEGRRLLLDGAHLVRDASHAGLGLEVVAVEASRLDRDTEEAQLARDLAHRGVEVVATTSAVLDALSPVRQPSGIVAMAVREPSLAADVCAHPSPFLLAIADVQDPGNVGALIRVAEAAGVTGVFVCGVSASPFGWKALRGAMGSSLRLPVVTGVSAEVALRCMKKTGVFTVASVAREGADPDVVAWSARVGLLVGGEGAGLPETLVAACDARVTIPMAPAVESLNVAVAAAILLYSARRHRS